MGLINLLFSGLNFWTRNPEKAFKDSNNLDFGLVSIKNWTKYFHLAVWTQGQVTQAKMAKNLPHSWSFPQNNETPNQKICFHCRLEDLPYLLRAWTAVAQSAEDYGVVKRYPFNTLRAGVRYIRTLILA